MDIALCSGVSGIGAGVVIHKSDQVAIVDTAANLVEQEMVFYRVVGSVLTRLAVDELQRRYAAGERNFISYNFKMCFAD